MANNEVKKLTTKFMKEAIKDAQLLTVQDTKTDMLKYGYKRKQEKFWSLVEFTFSIITRK